ncbi:MAG: suppressor of fused domain protein [Bacteroidota bacterium]
MNSFEQVLKNRFLTNQITSITFENELFYLIDFTREKGVKVLLTSSFHTYQMQVPQKLKGYEHGQLYFCIPEYWDLTNTETPEVRWLFDWLIRISNYTITKNTWLGDGHTYNCTKHGKQLSRTMRQDHLFISNPNYLYEELKPVELENKTIHFWALIPLFGDEMDYKQGKGTVKLKQKFLIKGVTEKLDEFRQSCLKNRWLFFK